MTSQQVVAMLSARANAYRTTPATSPNFGQVLTALTSGIVAAQRWVDANPSASGVANVRAMIQRAQQTVSGRARVAARGAQERQAIAVGKGVQPSDVERARGAEAPISKGTPTPPRAPAGRAPAGRGRGRARPPLDLGPAPEAEGPRGDESGGGGVGGGAGDVARGLFSTIIETFRGQVPLGRLWFPAGVGLLNSPIFRLFLLTSAAAIATAGAFYLAEKVSQPKALPPAAPMEG